MSRETKSAGTLADLQRLAAAMDANREELPQREPFRAELAGLLSKQLRQLLTDGQRLACGVRTAVEENYGVCEEKAAELGVQPFRGRAAKPAPEEPAHLPPPPAVSSASVPSNR